MRSHSSRKEVRQRMRNKWNRRTIVLAAAALIMTAGAASGRAMAYFTTYVTAEGGKELQLGFTI